MISLPLHICVTRPQNSQKTPLISPSQAIFGVPVVRIWDKIDHVITALHYIRNWHLDDQRIFQSFVLVKLWWLLFSEHARVTWLWIQFFTDFKKYIWKQMVRKSETCSILLCHWGIRHSMIPLVKYMHAREIPVVDGKHSLCFALRHMHIPCWVSAKGPFC